MEFLLSAIILLYLICKDELRTRREIKRHAAESQKRADELNKRMEEINKILS